MILNFDMQDIIKSATNLSTFRSGLDLYKNNMVKHFNYHEGLQRAFSKVDDDEMYTVDIAFTERGFDTSYCECRDFHENDGNCKHIAATLIYAKLSGGEAFEKNKLSEVMDYYLNEDFEPSEGLETVMIEYEMMFHREEKEIGIAFKIGVDKTYVVKDIIEFFHSIENQNSVVFGKKFTFDPYFHAFSEKDMKIMAYLSRISETHHFHKWGDFSESNRKHLMLSPKETLKVLNLLKDRTIDIFYKDKPTTFLNTEVTFDGIDRELTLLPKEIGFALDLLPLNDFISLEENYSIFYHDFKLIVLDNQSSKELKPLLDMVHLGYDALLIPEEALNDFIAYMYPIVDRHFQIKLNKDIKNNVEWKSCEARLYLDLEDDRIVASLKYVYGDHVFDAFQGLESDLYKHIVIRDLKKENHVMHLIEAASFKVSKTGYYLEDPDAIYLFLREGLKALSKKVTIYYAEDFKTFKMIKGEQLSFVTSFTGTESFFDFSFDLEGINVEEMAEFIKSLKEKKKYHRLKDGTFIDLDHAYFHKMSDIFLDLDLDSNDVVDNKVMLPVYFSMYLNSQLSEFKDIYTKSSHFDALLEEVNATDLKKYDMPNTPGTIIRDYQEKGFNWLKTLSTYHFGGILADDMGLGKTLQTLMYIASEKEERDSLKVLIVAPTSLTYNWLNEIHKFFPNLSAKVIEGTKKQRTEVISNSENFDLMITSYALVRNDLEMYQDLKLDICIIDEAQHIKNPDSKTAKAIKKLKVSHRFALTGTPIENGLSELWSIFDFIMPQYLGNIHSFKQKYDHDVADVEHHEALRRMIQPFILRRLKKDVLKELPDKIENKMVVELLEEQKKVYVGYLSKVKEDLAKAYADDGFNRSQMKTLAALTRLRQIALDPSLFLENYTGKSAKFELLKELLEELLAGKHKVLIFSQFTGVLSKIKDILNTMYVPYYSIDGSTPSIKRHQQVEQYNTDDTPIFLISLKAGGTGLNLTGADTVIHFDPWWNPAVENQATDRAHRIGQKNTVHVIKLITKGTIEEKIFALQEKKKELIEKVIQPGETWITKLSEHEIKDLFI